MSPPLLSSAVAGRSGAHHERVLAGGRVVLLLARCSLRWLEGGRDAMDNRRHEQLVGVAPSGGHRQARCGAQGGLPTLAQIVDGAVRMRSQHA